MATTQADLEITRVIDGRPLSSLQILVIVLCSVNVFIDGYDIQVMALAVPPLTEAWGLPGGAFTWALTAGIVGGVIGGAFLAPLGDRYGRRPILVWATVIMSVGTFLTATSSTVTELVIWRLVMGVGMGASVANAIALTSEFMPAARRARLITLMYCNIALGAFTAGFVAPPLIAAWGWQSIFVLGGILPMVLAVALYLFLPESVRFLMEKNTGDPRIASTLRRMAPDVDPGRIFSAARDPDLKLSVSTLLTPIYRARTLLIWSVFFLNMFVLYMLISWLPQLLVDHGWAVAQAQRGAVLIQAGGIIGGLTLAFFVDRDKTVPAMIAAYAVTTVGFGLFMVVPSTVLQWGALLLVIGGGTSGAQFALQALVAVFYPPTIRATGIGWASALGRSGAVLAPLAGGLVVAMQLEAFTVLGMLAVPVLLCAICIMLLPVVVSRSPQVVAA